MPSRSAKQARTMQAAAHNEAFAKRMGIPQEVAEEFRKADTSHLKAPKGRRKPAKKSAKGSY
jgi:hypothetical protein